MMKLLKKVLSCLAVVAVFGLVIFAVLINQAYHFWWSKPLFVDSESILVTPETIVVMEGHSANDVAAFLKEADLIPNIFWFRVYVRLSGHGQDFKPGEFDIQPRMNYSSIVDILRQSDSEEITITIPEGYTLKQIGEVVTANLDITTTEWALMTGLASPLEDHPFIVAAEKPDHVDFEGYLFPDSYRFFANATAEDVVLRMLTEMEEKVATLSIDYGRVDDVQNLHEALTLASIVEREVRSPNEMAEVAGIFYNRLEIGMALQADSTINYFTGQDRPSVTLADTEIESLYNTYMHAGLPPGAISNPGLNALQSIASPESNSYFYFLTSPEGDVYYAETFEQHIVNRNLYLR